MKTYTTRMVKRSKRPISGWVRCIKKAPLQKFRREAIPKTDLSIKNL